MSTPERPREVISATISGPVSGQVAVGKEITQTQTVGAPGPAVTEAELAELRQLFADLRARIQAEAPTGQQAAALERAGELEAAVSGEKPDLTTMEYVKAWFVRNLPKLAGAVTAIVVNPIVGKVVEAAGEMAAGEFRHRFGGDTTA